MKSGWNPTPAIDYGGDRVFLGGPEVRYRLADRMPGFTC
jgi:hypothetical protein